MALGPKELGSWANDPILSTEIRGGRGERWENDLALRAPMTGRPSRGRARGRRRGRLGRSSGFGLWGGSVLFQVVKNTHVIVGGIKLCSECAPNAFFEGDIDLPEFIGWQPQSNNVTDPHDDVIRNNLDSFRREILDEAGLGEMIVDFIKRFGFVITQDDSQHDFPVISCLLSFEDKRDEKKPAEQDPFHGSISSVR